MIELFIGSIFLSNILFTKYLGIRVDKKDSLYISLLTTIVTIIAGILNYLTYKLLDNLNAIYLRNIIFILTITIVSSLVVMIYKMITKNDNDILPMVVSNSIILGVSLIVTNSGYNFIYALTYIVGVSIGYILIMTFIYYLGLELNKRKVLISFRGYPIILIVLGILSMILERL